ncbi:MAG: hypothetical protein AAF741_09455 [Bacteroidota bacterium]
MGYGRWSSSTYSNMRTSYKGKSRDDIFRANKHRRIDPNLDPFRLRFRESRDSEEHPNSLAIALFLDVTGSMGRIPDDLVRNQLGGLMDTMLDNGVQDPQIMFSAVGDHYSDRAPIQVGQFESSTELINDGLSRLFLEGGGGGGGTESYPLAWHTCGRHTSIDCWEKRQQKGFLFTIGDERSHMRCEASKLIELYGYDQAKTLDDMSMLRSAQEMYEVFHIHLNQGSYPNNDHVLGYWRERLGRRLVVLDDYSKLGLLIAMVVAVFSGKAPDEVVRNQDRRTRNLLSESMENILV